MTERNRRRAPAVPTPVAAAAKKVATAKPAEAAKGEQYVALPKPLMDEIVKYLMTRPAGEVEHMTVPIRFGGAAREVTFAKPAANQQG